MTPYERGIDEELYSALEKVFLHQDGMMGIVTCLYVGSNELSEEEKMRKMSSIL